MSQQLPKVNGKVTVNVINSGSLYLPKSYLFNNESRDPISVPVYSFYIHHPASNSHVLFDLGLGKVIFVYLCC